MGDCGEFCRELFVLNAGRKIQAPTPVPHIKEMSDASQFYTNRVLKEYKDK